MSFFDSHKRILGKTFSWRICATLGTIIIVYSFTRKIELSLGIGLVEAITKTFLYYLHEHTWNRISWGRNKGKV